MPIKKRWLMSNGNELTYYGQEVTGHIRGQYIFLFTWFVKFKRSETNHRVHAKLVSMNKNFIPNKICVST